jgi:type VI secretion system secreted protein VgrG
MVFDGGAVLSSCTLARFRRRRCGRDRRRTEEDRGTHAHLHTFHIHELNRALRVVRLAGHEAISQLFQVEIAVTCEAPDVAAGEVVGRSATLVLHAGGEERVVHGIVRRFAHGGAGQWRNEYLVTLVPALWRLRLRVSSRIYQRLSVPEILAKVLERAGIRRVERRDWDLHRPLNGSSTYQMALGNVHRVRESCVQYRESDWDFLSRLMEEEGIHCFFEHHEDGHSLVISDAPTGHEPLPGGGAIAFQPAGGPRLPGEQISRFQLAEEVRPGRVVLSDYSFERPRLPLGAAAETGDDTDLEVFEHPGDYGMPETGEKLSRVRLEELQASRWTGEGESNSARLAPGRAFALIDHPSADLQRSYLITRIEYAWAESGSIDPTALPAMTPTPARRQTRASRATAPAGLPFFATRARAASPGRASGRPAPGPSDFPAGRR